MRLIEQVMASGSISYGSLPGGDYTVGLADRRLVEDLEPARPEFEQLDLSIHCWEPDSPSTRRQQSLLIWAILQIRQHDGFVAWDFCSTTSNVKMEQREKGLSRREATESDDTPPV